MTKLVMRRIINDLHTVAEALEKHSELGTPNFSGAGEDAKVRFIYWGDDAASKIAEGIRCFPGLNFDKNDPKKDFYEAKYYTLRGKLDVLTIEFLAERETVCNRVVTATETIVEETPDPAEVAKLPTIKTERVIETVEWQCVPLLAKATAS